MPSPVSALPGPSSPTRITPGAPGSSSTSTAPPICHPLGASRHRPLAALIQLLTRPASVPVQSGRQGMVTASDKTPEQGDSWRLPCPGRPGPSNAYSYALCTHPQTQPSNRLQGASMSSIPRNLPISHHLRSFLKLLPSSRLAALLEGSSPYPHQKPLPASCYLCLMQTLPRPSELSITSAPHTATQP